MINQIRKLLLVKDFIESPHGQGWHASCRYDDFKNLIIPAVVEYDRELLDQLDRWQTLLNGKADPPNPAPHGKKKKDKTATDLLIAKNPKNAYPIFQLFKKSERYSKAELIEAVDCLNEADKQLKSSSQNPKLVLESVILNICKARVNGAGHKAHGTGKG